MATAVRARTRLVAIAGAGAAFTAATLTAGGHELPGDVGPTSGLLFLQLAVGVGLVTAYALAAETNAREEAAARVAALDAARVEQRAVADEDALLARISLALQQVATTDERCARLSEILLRECGIVAEVVLHPDHPLELGPVATHHAAGRRDAEEAVVRPLVARGRLVGTLRLASPDGRAPDIRPALVDALTVRVGLAIENALLYERERDASHAMQLGLLGGPLPQVDGVELAASYDPATDALEVGGDWYDAFELPNGCVAMVVGDVVGHGLDAAISMGQLRGAVRSIASFSTPSQVLSRLDDYASSSPGVFASTVAYVEYDPRSGHIAYAAAGHPPPLLVTGTGARLLWGGRSSPLGCRGPKPRSQATGVRPTATSSSSTPTASSSGGRSPSTPGWSASARPPAGWRRIPSTG
jgi:hypothetical protein